VVQFSSVSLELVGGRCGAHIASNLESSMMSKFDPSRDGMLNKIWKTRFRF